MAVSYTHLDVYKRQDTSRPIHNVVPTVIVHASRKYIYNVTCYSNDFLTDIVCISDHRSKKDLDVYKRQYIYIYSKFIRLCMYDCSRI